MNQFKLQQETDKPPCCTDYGTGNTLASYIAHLFVIRLQTLQRGDDGIKWDAVPSSQKI